MAKPQQPTYNLADLLTLAAIRAQRNMHNSYAPDTVACAKENFPAAFNHPELLSDESISLAIEKEYNIYAQG